MKRHVSDIWIDAVYVKWLKILKLHSLVKNIVDAISRTMQSQTDYIKETIDLLMISLIYNITFPTHLTLYQNKVSKFNHQSYFVYLAKSVDYGNLFSVFHQYSNSFPVAR